MSDYTYGLFEIDANKRLIAELRARPAGVQLFPEVTAISPAAAPDFDLSGTDWILFPDLYSVDFFLPHIREKFQLDELRVCALGDSVSDRLRFSHVHADVIPPGRQTGVILSALAAYEALSGLNFLIPARVDDVPAVAALTALTALAAVAGALRDSGANVRLLPVYQTAPMPQASRFAALFRGGVVDEFIFTSPADVFNFAYFIEPTLAQFEAAATDELTFNTLREFGVQPKMYRQPKT